MLTRYCFTVFDSGGYGSGAVAKVEIRKKIRVEQTKSAT